MNPFRAGYSYTDRLNNKCLLTRACPAQEDLHQCITSLDNCPSSQHLLLKRFSGPLEKVSGTWLFEVSDAFQWSSNICPCECAESVCHTSITLANKSFFSSVIQNWYINFYTKKEQRSTKDLLDSNIVPVEAQAARSQLHDLELFCPLVLNEGLKPRGYFSSCFRTSWCFL